MKALEKSPADRYQSAVEMAADIDRYLSGEEVLAAPASYSRVMRARVGEHLRDLEGWMHDRIITPQEYDVFRRRYDRLVEREDAWIMEARVLTLGQVTLYLGAWVTVVAAALMILFRYSGLNGMNAIGVEAGVTAVTGWLGVRLWRFSRYRISIAYLLAFCLLLPATLLVTLDDLKLFSGFTQGRRDLELVSKIVLFRHTTNAQLWAAVAMALPAYYALRRFTRAPVFSLLFSVMGAVLCMVTLLRMGLLEWLDKDPGRFYFSLLPCALLFFVIARALEHMRLEGDSRYFYPLAVAFTIAALSGLAAFHEPYSDWLKRAAPWTRGQPEYLFLINAAIYFGLQWGFERFQSRQMRGVAQAFRFVLPGHVLGSLLFLGLAASDRWREAKAAVAGYRTEARVFEILLPSVACLFVLGSVPKQMKNYFGAGLLFLAIGVVRLQQDLLRDRALWPIALCVGGLALMAAAGRLGTPARIRRVLDSLARFRKTL